MVAGAFVDGFEPTTMTVFQHNGCHFHGYSTCYPNDLQDQVLFMDRQENQVTRWERYEKA